jgi:DNA-binding LytR/AlgR family response regulator
VTRPTALIADDEPLLREELMALLAQAWPELEVVAQARNGREAVERFEALKPDVCFLDVHMPGLSGVEAARLIGRRSHLVFVTAFDQYALKAFEQGAIDYLVKPVDAVRLADTVSRLQERLSASQPALMPEALLQQLAEQLRRSVLAAPDPAAAPAAAGRESPFEPQGNAPLRWIRATVGQTLRLIAVDDIDFLRSDTKYTLIAWRGDDGQPGEALIRTPLKELLARLDPAQFVQVHRAVVVNLRSISHVKRGDNETADIHLKGRSEVLPVSRSFLPLFRQM